MIARRTLLKSIGYGAVATACGAPAVLARTPVVLRYANSQPPSYPLNVRMLEAAERIKAQSNGEVVLRIFPSGQLGADTDTLTQAVSGSIELLGMTNGVLSSMDPLISLPTLGFAFDGYPEVWKAMDGKLGAFVAGRIRAKGLSPVGRVWDNGFKDMTSLAKPILKPEDLEGFKMRIAVTPMATSLYRAFGASPTPINFGELYTALQTRIVDGQDNSLSLIMTARLYEVQKHLSLTNHIWDGYWCLANTRIWGGLPADVRRLVETNIEQSCTDQRHDSETSIDTLKNELTAKGMTIHEVDKKAFQAKLASAGFYKEWQSRFGPEAWALMTEYSTHIPN